MNTRPTLDEVTQQGSARLRPSLTNPNWLVLRERRRIFKGWLERMPFATIDVLDVGGRIQPYRPLISHRVGRYVAVDVRLTPLVDVVGTGEQLPFQDGLFDLVVCTQVLEYVFRPAIFFGEIHRVLKPGGMLLLSAPSAGVVDAEQEYWRFLPAALVRLLENFARVEIAPEGGSVAGFFRTANACMEMFARYPAARALYRNTLCPLVNLTGAFLESLSGGRNHQLTANYSVLAEK
jgi:SAM-dependent methyltransferase